jgi:site-specific recombinase XerD
MLSKTFTLLFWLKKPKGSKAIVQPIYLRITVNGLRTEYSVQRKWDKTRWNSPLGRATGTKEDSKILNAYLDSLQRKAYEAVQKLIDERHEVTSLSIKNYLLGITSKPRMIIDVFRDHNNNLKSLIGNGYSKQTFTRYKTTMEHLISFLQWKHNLSDWPISDLNFAFISDFDFYLRTVRKCGHNSTMKYLSNFKKIVLICVKKDWLNKDPFTGFKLATKVVVKPFLNQQELDSITTKEFLTQRLSIARDVFLFSCYTGLAYIDVYNLKREDIRIGIDGEKWIFIQRQKTEVLSRIPLLPVCISILNRYKSHPACVHKNCVLPVWSNQKMNEYLKEIADLCGIHKRLTYHVARHTFGTTVTLNNGVPIESVAKMLGHSSLRMTQHYAKILDNKISQDMKVLREKLNGSDDKGLRRKKNS